MKHCTYFKVDNPMSSIVKLRIEPTVVLLSMRVEESVHTLLNPEGRRSGLINEEGRPMASSNPIQPPIVVRIRS